MESPNNATVTKMKDAADNKTLDLLPVPKKRGRPSTGQAKTSAERMRALRERARFNFTGRYDQMTLTALYDMLRYAVSNGALPMFDGVSSELLRRTRLVSESRRSAELEPAELEPAELEPAELEPAHVDHVQRVRSVRTRAGCLAASAKAHEAMIDATRRFALYSATFGSSDSLTIAANEEVSLASTAKHEWARIAEWNPSSRLRALRRQELPLYLFRFIP